jgi:hypothetical protein
VRCCWSRVDLSQEPLGVWADTHYGAADVAYGGSSCTEMAMGERGGMACGVYKWLSGRSQG